jgi:hypothetical protein
VLALARRVGTHGLPISSTFEDSVELSCLEAIQYPEEVHGVSNQQALCLQSEEY